MLGQTETPEGGEVLLSLAPSAEEGRHRGGEDGQEARQEKGQVAS